MADRANFAQYDDLPCTEPERRDDWFISERSPLEPEEAADIRIIAAAGVRAELGGKATHALEVEAGDEAVEAATEDLKRRRRRAIQSCFYDCISPARIMCLNEGLQGRNVEHGIWGGYTESERRQIVAAVKQRKEDRTKNPLTTGAAARIIISQERAAALNPDR